MQGEIVGVETYNIDEEELILTSFQIDNEQEITLDDVTREQFNDAHEVLRITDAVDKKLNLKVLDQTELVVSRDVLTTYKTLLYRSYGDYNAVNNQKAVWRSIAIGLVVAIVALITFFMG